MKMDMNETLNVIFNNILSGVYFIVKRIKGGNRNGKVEKGQVEKGRDGKGKERKGKVGM